MKKSNSNPTKKGGSSERVRIQTEIAERMAFDGESLEVATAKVTGKRPPESKVVNSPKKKRARRVSTPTISIKPSHGLVNAEGLLKNMWPDKASRPTTRWVQQQAKMGNIPSVRVGRSYFFEVKKVRAVLLGECSTKTLSAEAAAKLSNSELWAMLEKIEEPAERREFYVKHLKSRPGLY